jgi:uncharacterized protein (UPF0264 family)
VRLLVSVRNAAEARTAVLGGADIVDAKEPRAGALGAVAPEVLAAIHAAVPPRAPLSAALGDVATRSELDQALDGARVPLAFVKLGFAGLDDVQRIGDALGHAVRRAESLPGRPAVMLVAYADWRTAGGPSPFEALALLHAAGAAGLLVDTAAKTGLRLPHLLDPQALSRLGAELRAGGLLYALAGSLRSADFAMACTAGADVVGVRGAACIGGRDGRVDAGLVRGLRGALVEPVRTAVSA